MKAYCVTCLLRHHLLMFTQPAEICTVSKEPLKTVDRTGPITVSGNRVSRYRPVHGAASYTLQRIFVGNALVRRKSPTLTTGSDAIAGRCNCRSCARPPVRCAASPRFRCCELEIPPVRLVDSHKEPGVVLSEDDVQVNADEPEADCARARG